MRKKDRIDTVVRCGETNGWNVSADAGQKNGIVIFEFSKFTPAGQDFSFTATMKGKDLDNLIADMENYYDDFDVDEETYLWLDNRGHGKNGAPYRMRDVLEDMEAAGKMVEDLLDAIREIA